MTPSSCWYKPFALVLLLFLLSNSLQVQAQNTASVVGTIFDTETNKPLGFATVFIAQTTFGATASENGAFKLTSLPAGSHELVVSFLGYETLSYAFSLQPGQQLPMKVGLTPKPNALKEVVIRPDPHWANNYAVFLKNFIGQSGHAKQVRILNPEALYFEFTPETNVLTAEATEALVVENKALGYKLHFLLQDFTADFKKGQIFHAGFPRFEVMSSKSQAQQNRWQKERMKAYKGSLMHFGRALYNQRLEQEGFNVRRLQRLPNPHRPPEEQIQAGIKRWRGNGSLVIRSSNTSPQDSLQYWLQMARLDKIVAVLHKEPVPYENIVQLDSGSKTLRLQFEDHLQVVYTGEKEEVAYVLQLAFGANRPPSFQTSVLSLTEPYTFLEANGVIQNPYSHLVEGYWSWEKLAEMLPLDFVPVEGKK